MYRINVEELNPSTGMYRISFPNEEFTPQWAKALTGAPNIQDFDLSYRLGIAVSVPERFDGSQWYILGVAKSKEELNEMVTKVAPGETILWAGEFHCLKVDPDGNIGIYSVSTNDKGERSFIPILDFDADADIFQLRADNISIKQNLGSPFGEMIFKSGIGGNRLAMREFKVNDLDSQPRVREIISNPMVPFVDDPKSVDIPDPTLIPRGTYELTVDNMPLPSNPAVLRPMLQSLSSSFRMGAQDLGKFMGFSLTTGDMIQPLIPMARIWGGIGEGNEAAGIEAGATAALKGSYVVNLDGSLDMKAMKGLGQIEMNKLGEIDIRGLAGISSMKIGTEGIDISALSGVNKATFNGVGISLSSGSGLGELSMSAAGVSKLIGMAGIDLLGPNKQSLIKAIISFLNGTFASHTHPTGAGPSGPPVVLPTSDVIKLEAIKGGA
jgi:hypothetical protein